MQLRTSEVFDDILPIGRVLISSQIGLELPTENLQRSTLSNTVGTDKTQNLSGSWCRQTMKLEAVRGISVGDVGFKVGWQIDNVDGSEGAFLWANTTSNTQVFRDKGDLRGRTDFDTELSTSDHWARFLTLLSTFLKHMFSIAPVVVLA